MEVVVTARDSSVSNADKKHANEKAEKLVKFFNGIEKVEVILGSEGPLHRCEVILHLAKGEPLTAHEDDERLRAAIDLSTSQVQRILVKHKEKLRDHHRGNPDLPLKDMSVDENLETYQDVVEKTDFDS